MPKFQAKTNKNLDLKLKFWANLLQNHPSLD